MSTTPRAKYYSRRQLEDATIQPTNSSSNSSSALPPPIDNTVQFGSPSFAVAGLVMISVLFFLGFFTIYSRRYCSNDFDPSRHPRRHSSHTGGVSRHQRLFSSATRGLDPATIRTLPILSYNTQKDTTTTGAAAATTTTTTTTGCCDCVVCLSEFEDEEVVKVIPCCGHLFHPQCIDSWLLAHASCPLCRSTELFDSNSKLKECPAPAPAPAPAISGEMVEVVVVGREERGLGGCGMGRSRSWCCLAVGEGEKNDDVLPRRSCEI